MSTTCKPFLTILADALKNKFCINGAKKERSWNFGGCEIGDVEEYKHLGVTMNSGFNSGLKSMGDRMVDANRVLGMVKYAAARS